MNDHTERQPANPASAATPTGCPLPRDLVLAVVAGNADQTARLLTSYPTGTVNDRLTADRNSPTLLHLAAAAYANGYRRSGSRLTVEHYDEVVRVLLAANADPQLGALRPGDCSMPQTPAAWCDGCQPPSLYARMLKDAATDRVGWTAERELARIRATSESTQRRRARADARFGRKNRKQVA